MELRFYLVDTEFSTREDRFEGDMTDNEFIEKAEQSGMVYSVDGFVEFLNDGGSVDGFWVRAIYI